MIDQQCCYYYYVNPCHRLYCLDYIWNNLGYCLTRTLTNFLNIYQRHMSHSNAKFLVFKLIVYTNCMELVILTLHFTWWKTMEKYSLYIAQTMLLLFGVYVLSISTKTGFSVAPCKRTFTNSLLPEKRKTPQTKHRLYFMRLMASKQYSVRVFRENFTEKRYTSSNSKV